MYLPKNKIRTLFAYCLLISAAVQAQSAFQKESKLITAGYGFPNLYHPYLRSIFDGSDRYQGQYSANYYEKYEYSQSGFGNLFLKYEMGISKRIGLNVVASYLGASVTQTNTYRPYFASGINEYKDQTEINVKMISLGLGLNVHFGNFKKVDPYLGFAAGFSHLKSTINFTSNNSIAAVNPRLHPGNPLGIPLYLSLSLGFRYYFFKNIGIYTELGFDGWSLAQCGLACKFQ